MWSIQRKSKTWPILPELSVSKAVFEMKLKIIYCSQTLLINQVPYLSRNPISDWVYPKSQTHNLNEPIQTFLTRFPLIRDAYSSSDLLFYISQIFPSFSHLSHILAVSIYYTTQQQDFNISIIVMLFSTSCS